MILQIRKKRVSYAPYNNQVQSLKEQIDGIEQATVHKFQGKEKDTIIISTVEDEITDFVDDPYLLNVAVSRAKKKLILVVTGNEQNKERNIIIFYVVVMLFVSLGNAPNYAVTIIGLEDARAQAEEQVQNSESIEDEEKTTMIESQNNYVQQVKDVQKETFIIITAIDAILFVIGVIIQFKYTQKYMNDED